MRLINFGPGEIVDRLTILALKILYGTDQGKDVKHFEQERNALLPKLPSLTPRVVEHTLELAATNAAIWQNEDLLRSLRTSPVNGEAALVAHRSQRLNDRRAELVSLININTGDHNGSEKV